MGTLFLIAIFSTSHGILSPKTKEHNFSASMWNWLLFCVPSLIIGFDAAKEIIILYRTSAKNSPSTKHLVYDLPRFLYVSSFLLIPHMSITNVQLDQVGDMLLVVGG